MINTFFELSDNKNIRNFLLNDQVTIEILESCERGLKNNESEIHLFSIRSKNNLIHFKLNSIEKIIETLDYSINKFLDNEMYEYAARARDCKESFNKKIN